MRERGVRGVKRGNKEGVKGGLREEGKEKVQGREMIWGMNGEKG